MLGSVLGFCESGALFFERVVATKAPVRLGVLTAGKENSVLLCDAFPHSIFY